MTGHQIKALEELRESFRSLEPAPAARRGRFRRRVPALAVAGGLVLCAGAGAAGIALREDAPIPEPRVVDIAPTLRAELGTQRLAAVRVADPGGGPAWGLRLTTGESGALCATVGQVVEGRLGLVRDKTFRELPVREANTCLEQAADRPLTMQRRSFLAPGEAPRTAIFGIAAERVDHIVFTSPEGQQTARPEADGGYLAVFAGDVNPVRTIVLDSGERQVLDPGP
jgi:hypothetical protein